MNLIYKFYFYLNKKKYLGNIVDYILNLLYLPVKLHLKRRSENIRRKGYEKQNYISICTIFKNESHNLQEWIEFHKLIGIDHIYLYNNDSSDNYKEIIQPYIDNGFVTLTEWPYKHAQMAAYEDCYTKNRDNTFWLAFIDMDEFICPKYEYDIKDWIRKYEGYPSVAMYWQMFGTAGIMKADYSKLVIERFTTSWDRQDGTGKYILCTAMQFTPSIHCHHTYIRYKLYGINVVLPMINEKEEFVFFPMLYKYPKKSTIQLNHYFSKSYEEFKNKVNKGSAAQESDNAIRMNKEFFTNHEKWNTCDNKVIFRYLTLLKEQMNRS